MDRDLRFAALGAFSDEGFAGAGGKDLAVREESHLDDMRSAIRGDFERLAKRRGEQDLMRVSAEAEEQVHVAEEADETGAEEPRRRSWLARLLTP